MSYTKPQIVAQNSAAGSYAAGCPTEGADCGWNHGCRDCERTS